MVSHVKERKVRKSQATDDAKKTSGLNSFRSGSIEMPDRDLSPIEM